MKTIKTMFALEYKSYDGNCTFDIFETFNDARKHAKIISKPGYQYAPLYIFRAGFNQKRIHIEDGG